MSELMCGLLSLGVAAVTAVAVLLGITIALSWVIAFVVPIVVAVAQFLPAILIMGGVAYAASRRGH